MVDVLTNYLRVGGLVIPAHVLLDSTGVPIFSGANPGFVTLASQGYSSGKVSVSRPANATPYSANDVLGAAAAAIRFATVGPAGGGQVLITSATLEIDVAAVPVGMAGFNLYLYNITPPSALADNAPFDLPAGDRAASIGKISLGVPIDEGSTLKIRTDGINQQIAVPVGGVIFGYLVTTAGFTPAGISEVYVVTLYSVAV